MKQAHKLREFANLRKALPDEELQVAIAQGSVATSLRGDHFHRDHRYPGDHLPRQSGSGVSV